MNKPKLVYRTDGTFGQYFWTTAINAIALQLKFIEEFLDSDMPGVPNPEVIASLQDNFNQIGERLWLKSERSNTPALPKQETTEF